MGRIAWIGRNGKGKRDEGQGNRWREIWRERVGMRWREMRGKGINITKCKRDITLPSSPTPRKAICLLDEKGLSHTVNIKRERG